MTPAYQKPWMDLYAALTTRIATDEEIETALREGPEFLGVGGARIRIGG